MTTADMKPAYMTIKQVAIYFAVEETTIRRLIYGKQIPARKIGRTYRVPIAALDQIGEKVGSEE